MENLTNKENYGQPNSTQRARQSSARKGGDQALLKVWALAFLIVDETLLTLQPLTGDFVVGGGGVPAVMVACKNCGNLWYHALAPIGMLPEHSKEKVR